MKGGFVCYHHGGQAPQVKRKAQLRIMELVDPAIATMGKILVSKTSTDMAKLRAAENILDRAGLTRKGTSDIETAKALLTQRLLKMRAEIGLDQDGRPLENIGENDDRTLPEAEPIRGEVLASHEVTADGRRVEDIREDDSSMAGGGNDDTDELAEQAEGSLQEDEIVVTVPVELRTDKFLHNPQTGKRGPRPKPPTTAQVVDDVLGEDFPDILNDSE